MTAVLPRDQADLPGPRIGSLFSGYGGLEQGVQQVLGGSIAWHCEIDPGASRILAHRHPDVPNLGDITAVDWAVVQPVDVLVGGFPCQDVSGAGPRRGLHPDTRSGLWSQFAYAIARLRPSLVLIENVRGLLSAEAHHPAHGDVEPCPWCVGDADAVALRALGAVLGDLADLGFDAEWVGVRASDVDAPHERFRVFVLAWPAEDADIAAGGKRRLAAPGSAEGGWTRADAGGRSGTPASDNPTCRELGHAWLGPRCAWCGAWRDSASDPGCNTGAEDDAHVGAPSGRGGAVATHADGDAVRAPAVPLPGRGGAAVAEHAGAHAAADPDRRGRRALVHGVRAGQPDADRRPATDPGRIRRPGRTEAGSGRPDRSRSRPPAARPGAAAAADSDGGALVQRSQPRVGARRHPHRRRPVDWGPYTAAIRRWERALGRPAPAPTEPGGSGMHRVRQFAHEHGVDGYTAREMLRTGRWGARLAPPFVEWLMGLVVGWVTAVPELTRNEQLKALGNGVVPQQAAYAVALLLDRAGWDWREAA